MSLAIADTLVGALSVPLYIAVGIHPQERLLTLVFQCVDVYTGVVSIFTLANISLERMHAILWPLRHRTLTSRFYKCVIGIPWVFGLLGISARLLNHFDIISPLWFVIMINTILSTPLLITVIAYALIWRKQQRRLPNDVQANDQDKKLAKTLFIISGAFIITWFPHEIINIVFIFCTSCEMWPSVVFHIMKLLQFSNSFINVIVYPLRIPEYREALIETVLPCAF